MGGDDFFCSLNETSWRRTLGREILSDGTSREQMGAAIRDAVGDVNGDGVADLAIGAYREDLIGWDAFDYLIRQSQ